MKQGNKLILCGLIISLLTACGGKTAGAQTTTQVKKAKATEAAKETTVAQETAESKEGQSEDTRPQKEGNGETFTLTVDQFEIEIPSYWGDTDQEDHYSGYAESGGKAALLSIYSSPFEGDAITPDIFVAEDVRQAMFQGLIQGMAQGGQTGNGEILKEGLYDAKDFKGALCTYKVTNRGFDFIGHSLAIPCVETNSYIFLNCMYSNNTDYRYDDAFEEIIQSIHKVDSQ